MHQLVNRRHPGALEYFEAYLSAGCSEDVDLRLLKVQNNRLIDQQKLGNKSKAGKASKSQPNSMSADVTSNTPNAGLYAMPLQHTQKMYKHRFQSAPSIVASSSNPASTALQAITNVPVPPANTVRGVSTLVKEGAVPVSALVQQPTGKYVLPQHVMQQFPLKSRQWLVARQDCVTGSSCSIILGLYDLVEPGFSGSTNGLQT